MPARRVVFACALANPLATAWVRGLGAAGHRVLTVDQRPVPPSAADLAGWGVRPDDVVLSTAGAVDATAVTAALGGPPDVVVSWWGQGILPLAVRLKAAFPAARLTHVVDTFPDAAHPLTEAREVLRYRRADRWVDGYIYYSQAMARRFRTLVPGARAKPGLALVEPFPLAVHRGTGPGLTRVSDRPHVVFTGRADLLFSRDPRTRKDALGPFLAALAARGVEVFVGGAQGHRADLPAGLHAYPAFSNADLFSGRLSAHLGSYDAHLVAYHEWNPTVRRRVAAGLSTRLALALTATAPIAVSRTSAFVAAEPFALPYEDPGDLAAALRNRARLADLRATLTATHERFSFESQLPAIEEHLTALRTTAVVR